MAEILSGPIVMTAVVTIILSILLQYLIARSMMIEMVASQAVRLSTAQSELEDTSCLLTNT
jgi:hypothetical protein